MPVNAPLVVFAPCRATEPGVIDDPGAEPDELKINWVSNAKSGSIADGGISGGRRPDLRSAGSSGHTGHQAVEPVPLNRSEKLEPFQVRRPQPRSQRGPSLMETNSGEGSRSPGSNSCLDPAATRLTARRTPVSSR